MPMLHSCTFPDCATSTLSTYCYEHEQLVRAELEGERAQRATRDELIAREIALLETALARPELPLS